MLYAIMQWSLYFNTTHGAMEMWSYNQGGLNIKGSTMEMWSCIAGGVVIQVVLIYSGPSILRPPMGPSKYGLTSILQVVLK